MQKDIDNQLIDAIDAALVKEDGKLKLACADALKLAEKFGVKPTAITRICNQRKIKICKCQLGCFK